MVASVHRVYDSTSCWRSANGAASTANTAPPSTTPSTRRCHSPAQLRRTSNGAAAAAASANSAAWYEQVRNASPRLAPAATARCSRGSSAQASTRSMVSNTGHSISSCSTPSWSNRNGTVCAAMPANNAAIVPAPRRRASRFAHSPFSARASSTSSPYAAVALVRRSSTPKTRPVAGCSSLRAYAPGSGWKMGASHHASQCHGNWRAVQRRLHRLNHGTVATGSRPTGSPSPRWATSGQVVTTATRPCTPIRHQTRLRTSDGCVTGWPRSPAASRA